MRPRAGALPKIALQEGFRLLSLLFPSAFLTPIPRIIYDPMVEQSTGLLGCTEAGKGSEGVVRVLVLIGLIWCCLVLFGPKIFCEMGCLLTRTGLFGVM